MKAGELHILLHHHISGAPYPDNSQFHRETVSRFREEGLMDDRNMLTEKGEGFVETLKKVEPRSAGTKPVTRMRKLHLLYQAVASVVADDRYLDMSEGKFVGEVMMATGGVANPVHVAEIYRELIDEAFSPAMQRQRREERYLESNSGSNTPRI